MNNEEEILLSEKELREREFSGENEIPVKPDLNLPSQDENLKLTYTGSTVGIQFETNGRFSIPDTLHFSNYKTKHMNDLGLSRQEDLLENVVIILNDLMVDKPCKIEDFLPEELFEVLVAIKHKFRSKFHTHRWMHDCQNEVDDKDKELSEFEIDLSTLKTVSIEEADDNLRQYLKERYEQIKEYSTDLFMQQVKKLDPSISETDPEKIDLDLLLKDKKIKEPFTIFCPKQKKKYEFRFTRIGDVIKAKNFINSTYSHKIKEVRKQKWNNKGSLKEFKDSQDHKLKLLNDEKNKNMLLAVRAFSILRIDDKEVDDFQKFKEMQEMEVSTADQYAEFLEAQQFGIVDERDYECSLCGETDRRSLNRTPNLLEFILDDTSKSGKSRINNETTVFIGL